MAKALIDIIFIQRTNDGDNILTTSHSLPQNNANYYREYFVGPYCSSNGKSIHLGVFLDEGCSIPADGGVYESMNNGASLPYASKSLIEMDCISCEEVDEDVSTGIFVNRSC